MQVLKKCTSAQHLHNTRHGVCEKCYGKTLLLVKKLEVGEAVGTIAASINR